MQRVFAMLDRTTTLALENQNSKTCEQCKNEFLPRQGRGGKPQRFCSTDCRLAFHSGGQHSQRSPTCSALVPVGVIIDHPRAENAPEATAEDFDWGDAESLIVPEQNATACYFNKAGELVIRQKRWPGDDSVIFVAPGCIADFIDKLTDICGVPSVGK